MDCEYTLCLGLAVAIALLSFGGCNMRYGIQYMTAVRQTPITRFFDSRLRRDKHALAMVLIGCKLPILYIKEGS